MQIYGITDNTTSQVLLAFVNVTASTIFKQMI